MKTEYLPSFIKDLTALKGSPYFEKVRTLVFNDIPKLSDIDEVKNIKKLKGNKPFYRVRVGNYRIGFRLDNNIIACPVKCSAYLTGGFHAGITS